MSPTQKRTFRVVVVVLGVLLALSVVALAFAQDPAPQPRAPRTSNPERLPTEASAEELAASAGRSGPAWMPPPDGMREAQLRRLGRITEDMSEAEVAAVLKADAQSLVKRFGQPQPNPRAHAKLMANEKAALAAGKTPKAMGLALTGEAQVLAVMTEHSGPDTFTQPYPDTAGGTECITPTEPLVFEGPRFNEIPNPAGTGDNWTFWVEDYSPELLHEMLFGQGPEAGVQERVRPDLRDPNDGRRGIDLRGQTMANFYLDVSQGLYTVDGEVHTVTLPHSLAWYGADECVPGQGAGFNDLYGPAWKMAVHSARELNEKYPGANRGTNADFDWRDWDTDKDGYVDHFFIVHAGVGEASGGGNLDAFSMWAHSWDVNFAPGEGPGLGGMQVMSPTADYPQGVWLLNYTVSDESSIGVFIHEYGHDIGLPDLYDTGAGFDNSVGLWDLMSSGSYAGYLGGTIPSGMGIWDRYVLGWADPSVVSTEGGDGTYKLGHFHNKPQDSIDGLRVDLPPTTLILAKPFSGLFMWWSGRGDNLYNTLSRTFDFSENTDPITLTFFTQWGIEEDWDYAYVAVTPEDGELETLPILGPDGEPLYADTEPPGPNDTQTYPYGLTGNQPDWISATVDLSAYAGEVISLTFLYQTDGAVNLRGWFIDNIRVADASGTIFFDDVEDGPSDWEVLSHGPTGQGGDAQWRIFGGSRSTPQYYLAEWRNAAGADEGLDEVYYFNQVIELENGYDANVVNHFSMHVPGMLLWIRNFAYPNNQAANYLNDPPSSGPKGMALVVDSHPKTFDVKTPNAGPIPAQFGGRRASFDGTFTLDPVPSFNLTVSEGRQRARTTIPEQQARPWFHDRMGYHAYAIYRDLPGTDDDGFYLWDLDAGVVIPSRNNISYRSAFFVDRDTHVPGRLGQPGLWGGMGVNLVVTDQGGDGSWGEVRYYHDESTIISHLVAGSLEEGLEEDTVVQPGDVISMTAYLYNAAGSAFVTAPITPGGEPINQPFPYVTNASFVFNVPAGLEVVPESVRANKGSVNYHQDEPGTEDRGAIVWRGALGDTPLNDTDVMVQFDLRVTTGPMPTGQLLNIKAILDPDNTIITHDNFGQELEIPFRWPAADTYDVSTWFAGLEWLGIRIFIPALWGAETPPSIP